MSAPADQGPVATPPAPEPVDPVTALELRLGLALGDRSTALAALTHKSFVNEHRGEPHADNERLEFLGDAVIDLAVSHRLMERFPAAREGELSKMRAAVVDEQGLAGLARALDLGPLLRLGRGEELTGGRRKASLLADAMEAVIAAVYLDGGLDAVLGLVDRFLGEAFARASAGTLDRDWKTQLQELAQSRVRATPRYRVAAEHGPDHAKVFEVELELKGEVLGSGQGRSKKDAEQAAAKAALEALQGRLAAGPAAPPPAAAQASDAAAEATPAAAPEPVEAEPVEAAEAPQGAPHPEVAAPLPWTPTAMHDSVDPVVQAPTAPRTRPARVPKKKAASRSRPAAARSAPKARKGTAAGKPPAAGAGRARRPARPGR